MAIRPEDQFLQGQISALRLICQFLIEELAATEEARQRIMDAMKKAGNELGLLRDSRWARELARCSSNTSLREREEPSVNFSLTDIISSPSRGNQIRIPQPLIRHPAC